MLLREKIMLKNKHEFDNYNFTDTCSSHLVNFFEIISLGYIIIIEHIILHRNLLSSPQFRFPPPDNLVFTFVSRTFEMFLVLHKLYNPQMRKMVIFVFLNYIS